MAKGNFPACLKVTLAHEGGWADHPSDPGGATMKGITIGRFRQYKPNATKSDLRAISDAMVERIYRDDYWKPVLGDDLQYGVDLAVFDFAVNSGPPRAARYLQAVVGAKQDGVIGPETLKAAILAGGKSTIQKLCAKRLSFVQGLSTFKVFGKGWSRRIADVEAKAVAMWLGKGGVLTDYQRDEMLDDAAGFDHKADGQNGAAGGAGAGGGAMVGVDAMTGEPNWMFIVAVAVVAGLLAVLLIAKALQNRERAEAYRAVAVL